MNKKDEFINHSGGAVGSDTMWDKVGTIYGYINHIHYWMNNKTPNGNTEITESDSFEGQVKATEAARRLGRIGETHQVRDERIIRNWCQVKYSDAIYAIGTVINPGTTLNYGKVASITQVKGGTGYAVEMGNLAGKKVYVFDQPTKQWYLYHNSQWSNVGVPILTKNYAGIGTRQILPDGLDAIKSVFILTTNSITNE